MALGFEKEDSVGKRKSKRPKKWKLSIHERAEVRSEEEGFLGSWHPGTVIASHKYPRCIKYDVKYDHILVDDGSDHLVDRVHFSLAVNENYCANEGQCNYRGLIRPLPPPLKCAKWGLAYGMCVDVLYKEGWWEGVIFDHKDGSEERKIFFPDMGDEMMTHIDKLRITQDWNEITGVWQCRGTWLFLEFIEEYGKEHYIPVSTKQLWYDLREKDGYQKLGDWTSSVQALWEELVVEAIGDNLKVVINHLSHVIGLPERTQQFSEFAKPVNDVNIYPKAEFTETHAMLPIENMAAGDMLLYPDSPNVQPIQETSNVEQSVSLSWNYGSNMNLLTDSNTSFHDKALCLLPQPLLLLPSHPNGISVVSSIRSGERFSSSNCNNISKKLSSSRHSTNGWLPAGPDLVPGAAFCPDAVTKYAQMDKTQRPHQTLILAVRKHLSHLRWKIEFLRDKSIRLRYTSPHGTHYLSLRQVCKDLSMPDADINSSISREEHRNLHNSPGDSSFPLIEQPPDSLGPDHYPQALVSTHSDVLAVEPEYCPQAIDDWYHFGYEERLRGNNKKADIGHMTLRARKHLSALGWVFWYAERRGGKRELRYTSPSGRSYSSLRSACKDCLDGKNVSKMVKGQLAGQKIFSEFSEMEIQKSKNCSMESFCASLLRTPAEHNKINVLGTKKLQRRRKDGLHLSSCLLQTVANSDAQNIGLPKLRRGRKSRGLIKSQNEGKHAQSTYILRSSKRVQRVVVPNPSHHNPRTVLSWLIDNNVVLPREKVHYGCRKDGRLLTEGQITRDGIKCSCCSKVYTISGFEVHAGSKAHRPAANIFLEDGRSLLDCQRQIINDENMRNFTAGPPDRLNDSWHQGDNDYICSVCHYGGELILCDQCPSSFHKSCLGMKDVPDGDWFCPSCCCRACGQNKLETDTEHLMDDGVLCCTQCEHKYHIGCLINRGADKLDCYVKGNWFCSNKCEVIFLGLQELLGKPIPVGVDNLTWTLVKSMQSDSQKLDASDVEVMTESYSKLKIALDVMHECFEPVEEPHTRRDIVKDIIFSNRSELNRLNFQGFYTVLLEKHDELITVATIRVYGEKVAEMPLVGTRFQYRRLGMCRILINVLEKKLMELGVQRLILPAVPSVLNTWTGSFGFSKMTDSERLQFVDYTFLDFQDTVMCHKLLMKIPSSESSLSREIQPIFHDGVCGQNINNLDGSTAATKVFQADQIEGGLVEQGKMDIAAGNRSSGGNSPVHMANQPSHSECDLCVSEMGLECLIKDSTFKKGSGNDGNGLTTFSKESTDHGNGDFKCYKRRKILACGG